MAETSASRNILKSRTIRMGTRLRDGVALIRALIRHPMETGFRLDPDTQELVPAHYITHVIVKHNDVPVLHCDWSRAISKNPYLAFEFENAAAGDRIHLSWSDNRGDTDEIETVLS